MVDRVIPYLINLGDVIPSRSQATLLSEMAMGLVELINIYGVKLKKLGKVHHITSCFWPVRLIPLNETRACVCSYLLNTTEVLFLGKFKKIPPKPDNVITGADPASFLTSLTNYNKKYLSKGTSFKRGKIIQEALFNSADIDYFKTFFLNQYNISSFSGPHFSLEGDPIAKSVNQIKMVHDIYEFIELKDVKMLDNFQNIIINLCERWIKKGAEEADKFRDTKIDTSEEEKQLAILNKELQKEKERDLHATPEELIQSGKYKINDKTGDFSANLDAIRNSNGRVKNAVDKKDLFLLDEAMKELVLRYMDLGNSIKRYENEISQLHKNIDREISDIEKTHQKRITDLERKIADVERQIENKHSDISTKTVSAEDIVTRIKAVKQSCLDNIEYIKDQEMNDTQQFLKDFTIELKTKDVVVGIPIFIFHFTDPNTKRTTKRIPVLPILVDNGKIVSTKVKEKFRSKLEDLMNKYNPVVNLVEKQGEQSNLMEEIKNLDTKLEQTISDLRIKRILGKKIAEKAQEIINELVW
ncbi:MAG: hypothetical protein KGD57_09110 [Candidatus Lokiarchaeota archaeon]|nr:hypothetical protein [Candidatus Lokiarchaeota archaeon]